MPPAVPWIFINLIQVRPSGILLTGGFSVIPCRRGIIPAVLPVDQEIKSQAGSRELGQRFAGPLPSLYSCTKWMYSLVASSSGRMAV